jgi:hypothetical protein
MLEKTAVCIYLQIMFWNLGLVIEKNHEELRTGSLWPNIYRYLRIEIHTCYSCVIMEPGRLSQLRRVVTYILR